MSIKRAQVLRLMSGAFKRGQSASSFIGDMRSRGLSYRRTNMLSDWRAVNEQEVKEGLMRFVRKDRYPAVTSVAQKPWKLSQEYMFKVKITTQTKPGEPLGERFVNIMSDVPMTPLMVEQAAIEKWSEWENYTGEAIVSLVTWTSVHRTVE